MAVVAPEGEGFRYTVLESDGGIPFPMRIVDLAGDGIDELITAQWPVGYHQGIPPIYWYTVWQFHNGMPEDVSDQFPQFYRGFVLGQLDYPERLLREVELHDPAVVRTPLAEIQYVRLKFEHLVQHHTDAGLDETLAWARSQSPEFSEMGIWLLAEMPAPAAGEELAKLAASPNYTDLAKAALARRAKLMGRPPGKKE